MRLWRLFMREPFVLRVEIPSLDSLVTFLTGRERAEAQAKLDAYAAQVAELTKRLNRSNTGLNETVEEHQPGEKDGR